MPKWKDDKPWEQQPKESRQAYEAFLLYLQMGAERSLRKVEQKLHKSHALIGRWSAAWSWQKRCREYDAEVFREEFKAEKDNRKKMRERQRKIAEVMQRKAFNALSKLDEADLTPSEILRFFAEGVRIEKETVRENISEREREYAAISEEEATKSEQLSEIDMSKLTNEELDDLEGLLEKLHG